VKARAVKRLDADGPLADNLARIVAARVDEVCALARKAVKPGKVAAQHDMRIAVKRLRYVLELGDGCFGPYAHTAIRRTRELQDLLGEIHDCDVALPRVLARLDAVAQADATAVLARADGAPDLDPRLAARAPNAAARRGLVTLSVHLHARRALLFSRFLALWERTERDDFRARVLTAVGERPEVLTPASHGPALDAVQQGGT
jgi:hypothetical protein